MKNEELKIQSLDLKDSALNRIDQSFLKHINNEEYKTSDNLAHWYKTFSEYHDEEKSFDISKIQTYSRGSIIKANLGFNVGNEMGGLHYCLVLNKGDNHSYGVLNVVPLTSSKPGKNYPKYSVDLKDELYSLIAKKHNSILVNVQNKIADIINSGEKIDTSQMAELLNQIVFLDKIKKEISAMKHGSVALINQVTTISKQRIYDPKGKNDILHGIKLSNESLDRIDAEIKRMLTK